MPSDCQRGLRFKSSSAYLQDHPIISLAKRKSLWSRVLGNDSDDTNSQSGEGQKAEASATGGSSEAGQQQAAFGKGDLVTDRQFANEGMGYARDVEVTNGRYAMLG